MMFLCSVASKVSNYDSCQSVHFCVLIQLSFLLGDVIKEQTVGGSSRNEGVLGLKEVCGSLRCENFTNFSHNFCLWMVIAVKLNNRSHQH